MMGSTPPPPPPSLLLKKRMTLCFLCGKDEENGTSKLKDFVNEVPSSSALLHPFFPVPTINHLPQGIKVCRECEYIFDWMKAKGITDAKGVLQRAMFVANCNQEVFQEDEDVRELRKLIAYPCDFGWPSSSTFGFSQEDVAGGFGKLPNELLDQIFNYLDPQSLKNLRQVSSFMRNKTFPQIHFKCPIKILKWIKFDNFISWPHLKDHSNLELIVFHNVEVVQAEDRLKVILRGDAVKKLTLKFDSVKPEIISKVLNEVFTSLPKLKELDLEMDVQEYLSHAELKKKYSGWFFWTSIKQSLMKISLRSHMPDLKDFLQATPNVSSVLQYCNDNKLLDLLKRNADEDIILWPRLESINVINVIPSDVSDWPNRPPPPLIMDCLGPRPIKRLKFEIVEYPNLPDFVNLLQKYGDTLEWVEVVIHLQRDTFSAPYEEMDLPTNLKRLRGFKITIRDLEEEWHYSSGHVMFRRMSQRRSRQFCTICDDVWHRLPEWKHPRDFLRIGKLLKDPTLLHERFPNLRQLSLLLTPPPSSLFICPTCIRRKQAICDSLVPLQASNPDLRVVELSHPTTEEDPALYYAWRTRLAQAFPNAKIEQPS